MRENLKQLSFSEDEYRRRVRATQRAMTERDLSALVCHNLANICYLTGFRTIGSYGYGHYAVVLPAEGNPILFTSQFESHNAQLFSWIEEVITYETSPIDELVALLHDQGLARKRIGYEAGHFALTVEEYRELAGKLPDATLVEATRLLDPIKMIKSLPEIEVMRQAAAITSAGFAAAVAAIRAGALDNDVARAAYDTIIGAGGEDFSLQPIVTSGRRSGIPHSTFHRTPLKEGDVLLLELSTAYQRYDVHAMRTASIGEPPVAVRRAFDACLASVESLLQNIRGGASAREVARKAGGRLRAMEPDLMWHGCYGYSMGLTFPPACTDCIDGSVISEHADATLQPGMVLHCSTSLRNIGQYGTAVGECVLVTDDGCEILTQFPRELNGRAKAQLRE